MHLQVKKIVLWPRNSDLAPRVLPFEVGTVNVISGLSKTGKSAIIPIIDYCLGSEKCSIPVKTIRDACSWFGVVFDTAQGELLLARREPGQLKATGDMFVAQAVTVTIPERIDKPNANVEGVKRTLDELAGLTQLDFDPEHSGLTFKGRPSFRDMTAFVFQPQNIVANPNVLFFKSDSTDHREKLKTIFPYVLGAVTPEALALEHEAQRLRMELRRKERELESIRQVSLRWVAEVRARASRAHELGLLTTAPTETATIAELIAELRTAAATVGTILGDTEPTLRAEALGGAAEELVALQREEAAVSSTLSQLKQRYADMTRFREAATEYRGSLSIRRDRLQVADWIGGLFEAEHECPLCGTANTPAASTVESLRSALRQVEDQASAVSQVPAAFDREYQRVRADLDLETERINAVRLRRRTLQATSEEARSRQYQLAESARFAGGLEEALARYDQIASDGELSAEAAALRERVSAIEERLRALDVRAAVGRATQRFATLVGRILPELDTERPDDPVQLVIDELTIRVTGQDRDDYLWEIGSGANWLAYHVATSVALHQLFRSLPQNHVPSFVVYDQPSQVYFPRLQHEDGSGEEGAPHPSGPPPDEKPPAIDAQSPPPGVPRRFRDEDVIAVRKVFAVLANAARDSKGAWQVIILDHAGADVWGDVPGVHLVEDWHGATKLVPPEWLA